MDTDAYSDDEYTPPSSPEDSIYTSFGGGMFTGSQHFTIGGGTFNNNNTNHYHLPQAEVPSFRTIPMGDIDLQQELTVNEKSGTVDRRLGRERRCVRRVYSAKIDGRNTDLTVAMYQGDGAEEDWRRDVEIYMSLRHPNIVQMYGTAKSGAMYAAIFYGDLIPFRQILASASPIITVYIHACYVTEWLDARDYVGNKSKEYSEIHSTLWIRRSNGRLCADFNPQPDGKNEGHNFFYNLFPSEPHPPINPSSNPTSQEAAAIDSLTLEEYHEICWFTLHQFRSVSVSSSATIFGPGAIILFPPNGPPQEGAEILALPKANFHGWGWHLGKEGLKGVLMENDWTRFDAKGVCNNVLAYTLNFPSDFSAWLTQANHIFSRLRITSSFEDYVVVDWVHFRITIGNTREGTPPGYLFLCPTTDFQTGSSSFRWPECPAYWSLDPSGAERLSTEEATQLGFPSFQLTAQVHGRSWDTSVYAGLRQFHQAKGFDPESQDLAQHLGQPLYKVSGEVDYPFAHVEEDWSDDGTDEGETDYEWEDTQSSVEVEQDGDKSIENCDANEDEGLLNFSAEPREQNAAEACQEPAHRVDQDPNPAELRVLSSGVTGSSFIHHIIGGLQRGLVRGLVIENENVDAEPISPFLI